MKKVIIIHGWDGYPEEGWFPWLKKNSEEKGFGVSVPKMPQPDSPTISSWVQKLKETIGDSTDQIFLIGHSIGCQTILRYLETNNRKIEGAIFVAPWTELTPEATPDKESKLIAEPWIKTPVDWNKVKSNCSKFISMFSKDDPLVPVSEAKIFEKRLGGEVIVLNGYKHFSGEDGISILPIVLEKLLEISK